MRGGHQFFRCCFVETREFDKQFSCDSVTAFRAGTHADRSFNRRAVGDLGARFLRSDTQRAQKASGVSEGEKLLRVCSITAWPTELTGYD